MSTRQDKLAEENAQLREEIARLRYELRFVTEKFYDALLREARRGRPTNASKGKPVKDRRRRQLKRPASPEAQLKAALIRDVRREREGHDEFARAVEALIREMEDQAKKRRQ